MGVFTRFSDIVQANINSLLEQAEDPEKLVLLITQEMEETLVEVRSASARQIATRKEIGKHLGRLTDQANSWEDKAELAIRKGREDLARAALREKATTQEAAEHLGKDLATVDANLSKLQHDTTVLEEKLKEARNRQKSLILRGQTASTRLRVKRQLNVPGYEDAMDRFCAVERKMDEMEGAVEAYDMAQESLADEIGDLEKDDEINRELAALRDRINTHDRPAQQ